MSNKKRLSQLKSHELAMCKAWGYTGLAEVSCDPDLIHALRCYFVTSEYCNCTPKSDEIARLDNFKKSGIDEMIKFLIGKN